MPLIAESLPSEAVEMIVTGTFAGQKPAYYKGQWYEPVDGPDTVLVGVLSWEPSPS